MYIIPVIDLKNGIVVHAKHGQRDDYQPLQSILCPFTDIHSVIDCFLKQHAFTRIYIADLDAIMKIGSHADDLFKVLRIYPAIEFWIDSGYPFGNESYRQLPNYTPVMGTESFTEANVNVIKYFGRHFVLSLDHTTAGELGPKTLFANAHYWPDKVIIMTLNKVGSALGPDLNRLLYYVQRYTQTKFIAAGGIRNKEDLNSLEQIGINYALIATALHNGNITIAEIAHWG